jgi:NADH dehydrogenase FAD-containing subunit
MKTYYTVVVGTDGSDTSMGAVDRAASIAAASDAKLVVATTYIPHADDTRAADILKDEAYLVGGAAPICAMLRGAGGRRQQHRRTGARRRRRRGFGGCGRGLKTRPHVDVRLVNPRASFVERIRMHQLVAGSGSATLDYAALLHPDIDLVTDSATRIDTAERRVCWASGDTLGYDYVIYAVGSTAAAPSVPGGQFAYPIAEFEHARRLSARLHFLHPDEPVCVVGSGLTGIEVAAELAQHHPNVTLVCGGVLGPSLGEPGRGSVARQLRRLGVTVLGDVAVVEVRVDSVLLSDARWLPSAVTVWTAGFGVPELAARSGLRTDAAGRLLTDETLTRRTT